MSSRTKTSVWAALLAYCSTVGLSMDLRLATGDGHPVELFLRAMRGYPVAQAVLFAGLCALYAYALRKFGKVSWPRRDKVCVLLPAGLFAAFMVVGYSFEKTNSLDLVLSGWLQRVKSLVAFGGYFILFAVLVALLYLWLSGHSAFLAGEEVIAGTGLWSRYKRLLRRHPFGTAFVTLCVAYIPYVILSYPAIMCPDDFDMIKQSFGFPSGTSNSIVLLDENVYMNGHHPIAYTMLIHLCLALGRAVFHSCNAGIFLVSLLQLLAVIGVASYGTSVLTRRGVRTGALLLLLLYMIGAPRIQNYMFFITKDILVGCALLLFVLSLFAILSAPTPRRRDSLLCVLSGIAMGLLRNDGKYIILLSLVAIWLMDRRNRKRWAAAGLAIALVLVAFFDGLMPALHITPGSKREALSIPFQQTARYFRDYEAEVTGEEWAAVDAVLDAGALKERYVPTRSDSVKNTYKKTATTQELLTYFKVWLQMGLKHPGVYVQATMNNYYNFFYPGWTFAAVNDSSFGSSMRSMERINSDSDLAGVGLAFHHPEGLNRWRNGYESLRERLFETPVLSLLKSTAVYVWALLLAVFFLIKEKERRGLALTVPLLFSLLVCLAGPCNGDYFRYLYGVSPCLPFVPLLALDFWEEKRGEEGRRTENGR